MKYKLLLFDADETLFDFKKAERYAFLKTLEDFKINYDKEECMKIYHDINSEIWKEFEQGTITSSELKVERFNRLFKKIHIVNDANLFSIAYINHLSEASFIYDKTLEVLEYLKDNPIESFVIIDDETFNYEELNIIDKLVQTSFMNVGFTKDHKDMAIKKLTKKD